jgi:UDP-2,3-diacylglucosamine pyrophosphatase LpxH
MKVVVTSDQHLGYANSDKSAFNAFLDHLAQDSEATHFVLLGDVVDMWRRDASGVFLENDDTMQKALALKDKLPRSTIRLFLHTLREWELLLPKHLNACR